MYALFYFLDTYYINLSKRLIASFSPWSIYLKWFRNSPSYIDRHFGISVHCNLNTLKIRNIIIEYDHSCTHVSIFLLTTSISISSCLANDFILDKSHVDSKTHDKGFYYNYSITKTCSDNLGVRWRFRSRYSDAFFLACVPDSRTVERRISYIVNVSFRHI